MLRRTLMIAVVATLAAGNVSADAIGTWKTPKGKTGASAHVKIYKCGSNYCGKITRVIGGDQSVVGTVIMTGMKKKGKKYSGGRIKAPDEANKTYKATMTEVGSSKLVVRGWVGPFSRKQNWRRIN